MSTVSPSARMRCDEIEHLLHDQRRQPGGRLVHQ
jgi:hypothetical protein